ncbi:MAG: hypothetical protein RID91_02585 [Azospirillaceae bacterium]
MLAQRSARLVQVLSGFLVLGLLAACAAPQPTAYRPATNGTGYADRAVTSEIVEVRFEGNRLTDRGTVESYALYRAAEVAAVHGADRIAILDKTVEENRRTVRDYDPYPFGFGYGYTSGGRHVVGTRYGFPIYARPRDYSYTSYAAELLVRLIPPSAPNPDDAPVRDVATILQTLGPAIRRPAPEGT